MDKRKQLAYIESAMRAPRGCWTSDLEAERAEVLDEILDDEIEKALMDENKIYEAFDYVEYDQWKELCALEAKMFAEMRRGFCEETLVGVHELLEKKKEILKKIFRDNAEELLDWRV
jgi:hypothetical protein